jgi:alpha-N-arabinofuranosidase
MEGAVYASRMMNGFERVGDIVEANSISDLPNGWVGGIIQASRDRVYGTPQFYAVQLYGSHLGTDVIATTTNSPALDAVATRSQDASQIYLKVSNADPAHSAPTVIDVAGRDRLGEVKVELLATTVSRSRNDFSAPNHVMPLQ